MRQGGIEGGRATNESYKFYEFYKSYKSYKSYKAYNICWGWAKVRIHCPIFFNEPNEGRECCKIVQLFIYPTEYNHHKL